MPIFKNKRVARCLLRMLMRLHNTCYRYITAFAIVAEGGLHPKHRLMKYHAFFTDNIGERDTVLDIGCGNGFLSYDVARKARSVTAIDLSRESIEKASKNFDRENISYICGDASHYDFGGKFDVAIMSNVLEHIEHRVGFLLKISALAPKLLIRVPMADRDWLTGYKAELGVESRLDPTHYVEYTLESFKNELAEAGLAMKKATIQFGEIWAIARKSA